MKSFLPFVDFGRVAAVISISLCTSDPLGLEREMGYVGKREKERDEEAVMLDIREREREATSCSRDECTAVEGKQKKIN
jgi:hypothetical protein